MRVSAGDGDMPSFRSNVEHMSGGRVADINAIGRLRRRRSRRRSMVGRNAASSRAAWTSSRKIVASLP